MIVHKEQVRRRSIAATATEGVEPTEDLSDLMRGPPFQAKSWAKFSARPTPTERAKRAYIA